MIADAIQKVLDLKKPETITVDGRPFYDRNYAGAKTPYADTLEINNLTGMVDFIQDNIDSLDKDKIFIHVVDYNRVALRSHVTGAFNQRFTYVMSSARETAFLFGQAQSVENFIIGLHSQFAPTEDRNYLLELVSNLNIEASKTLKDSGVSQEVTVRKGTSSLVTAERIRNPVTLRPFRTFSEIEQPASRFVFRIHEKNDVPYCSLYESDGQFWKQDAITLIADWFDGSLDSSVSVIA